MVRSVALSSKFYWFPGKENTEDVTIRVTFMMYYVTIILLLIYLLCSCTATHSHVPCHFHSFYFLHEIKCYNTL